MSLVPLVPLVHCKNVENSNKVTSTQDISLQTQNGSTDAAIINSSLHQARTDNPHQELSFIKSL